MLGKTRALGKCKTAKSWQAACNQSNAPFTNGLASDREPATVRRKQCTLSRSSGEVTSQASTPVCGLRKYLILLAGYEFILQYTKIGPKA
jgi:hypothetical protein